MEERIAENSVYARPRTVASIDECSFYHTMEIPGVGTVEGLWDLRGAEEQYLGSVDLTGKRVLEIGPASGYLSFHMERQGAEVVALDLDEHQEWDVVPYANVDWKRWREDRRAGLQTLNNSFWFAHQAFNSRIRAVYGSVYAVPQEIGEVDISVMACVLLHLRDPFLALQNILNLTKDKVIITETFYPHFLSGFVTELMAKIGIRFPICTFIPKLRRPEMGTWWWLAPEAIRQFLSVLGFTSHRTTYHYRARHRGRRQLLYTVVGERTIQKQ